MGPAVNSYDKILSLIDAGMNVARINFSHGTHEEHLKVIQDLKKAREYKKVPLAIMLDTKGPEIRLGKVKNDALDVFSGLRIELVKATETLNERQIPLTPACVFDCLTIGTTVLFDDGYIISKVVELTEKGAVVEIQNTGVLKSQKGVNIPNVDVPLPAMTAQDIEDITFGCKNDIDIIAASFIRSADHVIEIKRLLVEQGKSDIFVIAKIENIQGVQNFDSILQVADGIMVARGDLGVELPLQEVPSLQKMMIRKCYHCAKPVVTATQMLESMIKNPRPTRAEVSDVANAIYDSTSAVMLSGETAVGLYPIEAVKIMKNIAIEAERNFNYREFFYRDSRRDFNDVSSSVSLATVKTAYSANARAIFAFTHRGFTARVISRFRPEMPILALTPNLKTYHQMALSWGIIPVDPSPSKNVQEAFGIVSEFALQHHFVRYGDLVVITAGSPFGVSGTTNMMIVDSIGDVLVRGQPGHGTRIHGKVVHVLTVDPDNPISVQDKIAVLSRCDDSYLPVLKHALGIVLQNHPDDRESEKHAMLLARTLAIPIICRADGALSALQEGQLVTLDPENGIVYKGSFSAKEESPRNHP
jgi:pyruvate kinase